MNGLISDTAKVSQELAMVHKIDAEHLWKGECPHGVADVLKQLVVEEDGEGGGACGIA